GDNDSQIVDVRLICATHQGLEKMVAEGRFREDLMFRINTFEIHLPPLRARSEDIEELAHHLLDRLRFPAAAAELRIAPETLRLLKEHDWPGNIRELANVIE